MIRRTPQTVTSWSVVVGTAVGAAAGAGALAFAVLRSVRSLRQRQARVLTELDALEDAAVETLRRDRATGVCAIDVAAIAPGAIELSGSVPTPEVAQRAARLLHSLPAVNTVVSRLEIGSLEELLADNRERLARGEASTLHRRWYGVRVGTGRRRQSVETEPARPDDTVERRTRELEVRPEDLADGDGAHSTPHAFDSSTPPL
ncbi:hypothetical protein BH23GEM9_BH23GEM9_10110 [soil metagenome]